jgi:hypothetical protein
MARRDPALTISNPRLLAAIYFGLLSVVGTILINAFLTLFSINELIPVFEAILIGVLVASCTGALFGEQIVHCKKPYKRRVFWLGFIMVIASLPVFDLGLFICMVLENSTPTPITGIPSMLYSYLIVLAYSYILFGIFLAIASGLAALYLRGRLVYDILHTYKESSIELQVLPVKVIKKPYHTNRAGRKTVK